MLLTIGADKPALIAFDNMRIVSRSIVYFLSQIPGANLPTITSQLTCLGHSLGSHVCGFVGQWTQLLGHGQMFRNFYLDAGGPDFERNDMLVDRTCRASIDDAQYTVALHTSTFALSSPLYSANPPNGLGTLEPIAHIDFMVDGGKNPTFCRNTVKEITTSAAELLVAQLSKNFAYLDGAYTVIVCQHMHAVNVTINAIKDAQCFKATQYNGAPQQCYHDNCTLTQDTLNYNLDLFANGGQAPNPSKMYRLPTTAQSPYCT